MDENIFDKIHDVDLKKTMENSYIDYAMSVIAARALPDVRVPINLENGKEVPQALSLYHQS